MGYNRGEVQALLKLNAVVSITLHVIDEFGTPAKISKI